MIDLRGQGGLLALCAVCRVGGASRAGRASPSPSPLFPVSAGGVAGAEAVGGVVGVGTDITAAGLVGVAGDVVAGAASLISFSSSSHVDSSMLMGYTFLLFAIKGLSLE